MLALKGQRRRASCRFQDTDAHCALPYNPKEHAMNRTLIVTALMAGAAFGASAQTTDSTVQRDVNQQQRIEQGLQNGTLTTREGAELERQQAAIDRLQQKALRDGTLSGADQARLRAAQNAESRQIYRANHNGVNGNPMSGSSQREQQEVQRNINQENRIQAGVANGGLNNREVSRLEGGESRVDRNEYRAGENGRVNAREEARVNRRDDRVSGNIHQQRWDNQKRK
jgi:hypothetical protein